MTKRYLTPFSWLYEGVIRARNWRYDHVAGASVRVGRPVISVGNLTVGGTGKTPFVLEVVRRLRARGRRPVVLTRGYGAAAGETADEVLEFQTAEPGLPIVVNPDRVAGAAEALRTAAGDCFVLDDGFQHRRIRRELDIVLIDALDPWGGGWLLPAGRLREPRSSLRRASLIVMTRANQVSAEELGEALAEVRRIAADRPMVTARLRVEGLTAMGSGMAGETPTPPGMAGETPTPPFTLYGRRGRPPHPSPLVAGETPTPSGAAGETPTPRPTPPRGLRVLPVCGLGNPTTFLRLVAELADDVAAPMVFCDHQRYGPAEVEAICAAANTAKAAAVVTTRKDWVKLAPQWPAAGGSSPAPPLLRLDVRLEPDDPDGVLDALLARAIEERA